MFGRFALAASPPTDSADLTYPQLVVAFLQLFVDDQDDAAVPVQAIVQRSFASFASPEASR